MGRCRICGKATLDDLELCIQCSSAQRGSRPPERRDRRPHSGSPTRGGRPERASSGLGSDYLQEGYFKGEYLRKEIFTSEAERVADLLSARGMTSASLRRFYNKLRGIYSRYNDTKNFAEIKPGLYSLYPNVADAVSRNANVPQEFRQFINANLKEAEKGPEHLKGFVEHYQSVLAYFKETQVRRGGRN